MYSIKITKLKQTILEIMRKSLFFLLYFLIHSTNIPRPENNAALKT